MPIGDIERKNRGSFRRKGGGNDVRRFPLLCLSRKRGNPVHPEI
jgi:hypothetical protein